MWNQQHIGYDMYRFTTKLKVLKAELRKLNKNHYSNISTRVVGAKEELYCFQKSFHNTCVTADQRCKESELLVKYVDLRRLMRISSDRSLK